VGNLQAIYRGFSSLQVDRAWWPRVASLENREK
jgi:hypothetical protein